MKRIFALIAVAVIAMTAAAQGHQNAKGSQVEQSTSLGNHKLWFNMPASELKAKAEQGVTDAQYYLGLLYLNGEGVTLDYNQAYNWFRRSAEQGYVPSIYYVGKCYLEGYGVTKDRGSAMDYFQRAANSGNSSAKAELMLLRSE